MKRNDIAVLHGKDIAQLLDQADALRKEYAVAKMQFKVGKLPNVKLLSSLRKKLAVCLTIVSLKQRAQS